MRMSSIIVVLNAKFHRLIVAQANQQKSEKRKSQTRVPFLLVETHKHLNFIAVLTVHTKTSLLYTFQPSMQANRNINLWQEKAPTYRLSRNKASKTQQIFHCKHAKKNRELFIALHGRRL